MSKGRSLSSRKELDDLQRAIRKQLKRIDLDRYHDLRDLVEKQYREDEEITNDTNNEKKLKEAWRCHRCIEGYLKILLIPRLDGIYYLRKCSSDECKNRTKMKRYDKAKVTGIIDSGEEKDVSKKK